MPKRATAPQIGEITAADHKAWKRLIKRLIAQRLGFAKSTLYDTDSHKPRYPLDVIGIVLVKVERKAIKIGRNLDFSSEERELLAQIFKVLSWVLPVTLLLVELYDFFQ